MKASLLFGAFVLVAGIFASCGSSTMNSGATGGGTAGGGTEVAATGNPHLKEVEGLTAVDLPMNGGFGTKQYVKLDANGGAVWRFEYSDEGKTIVSTEKITFKVTDLDKDLVNIATVQKSGPDEIFKYEMYSFSFSPRMLDPLFVQEKCKGNDAKKESGNTTMVGFNFRDEASATEALQKIKAAVASLK